MPLERIYRDISVKDSKNLDSFSKLRISEATTTSFVDFKYTIPPELNKLDARATGDGTLVFFSNDRSVELGRGALTTTSNVFIEYPTTTNLKAGSGFETYITFKIDDISKLPTGATSYVWVGLGDPGFFVVDKGYMGLYYSQGIYSIAVASTNIISSGGTTRYFKSSDWLDPLDGTGESGLTIDFTKVQIFYIKGQTGRNGYVEFGFVLGKEEITVLKFNFINESTIGSSGIITKLSFISTPLGPSVGIRYGSSISGSTGTILTFYNATTSIIGALKDVEFPLQFSHSVTIASIPSGSFKRAVSYRLNPLLTGPYFTKIILSSLQIESTGADGFYWELRHRESVNAGTWGTINSNSDLQFNTNLTALVGGAIAVITAGFVNAGESVIYNLPESLSNCYPIQSYDNLQLSLPRGVTIAIKPFSTSTSARITLTYKEIKL